VLILLTGPKNLYNQTLWKRKQSRFVTVSCLWILHGTIWPAFTASVNSCFQFVNSGCRLKTKYGTAKNTVLFITCICWTLSDYWNYKMPVSNLRRELLNVMLSTLVPTPRSLSSYVEMIFAQQKKPIRIMICWNP